MKYIYLIQGEAKRIGNYFHLAKRPHCRAYFLTYDKEVDGCIYYPNSTWAEGRNRLLAQVDEESYDYLIMVDDDVEFSKGNWSDFENALHKYQPAVAVPLVSKVKRSPIIEKGTPWEVQNFMINDEQCIAFHYSVVNDKILLPYVTKFDYISWWAACEIQQILILTLYSKDILQFNNIKVENTIHGRHDASDKSYKSAIRNWLAEELKIPPAEIWHYWEDWPGVHVGFNLDKFLAGRTTHKWKYERNFKLLIANTHLFQKRLPLTKVIDYTIAPAIRSKTFNSSSRYC